MANTATTTADAAVTREYRKVLWASWLGTAVEFYDFALYTALAALVFGPLFFAGTSPIIGTIASLGTLAVGYVARPIGAIIFGHIGDKVGRKRGLILSMSVMGGATVLMGLLPTSAQVGPAAAILLVLLRIIQGIGVGGDWGGAGLMTYEHAPANRRGFAGSIVNAGTAAGVVLASGIAAPFFLLPKEQFEAWGWRAPLLLSIVIIGISLWMRTRISESPVFLREVKDAPRVRIPLLQVLRHPSRLMLALLASLGQFFFNSLINNFSLVWASTAGGVDRSQLLLFQAIANVLTIALTLTAGRISDRVGYKKVMLFGLIGGAVYAFAFLPLLSSGNLGLVALGFFVAQVFMSSIAGPITALVSGLFGSKHRYSGASLGYQLAATVGGLAPLIFASFLPLGLTTAMIWVPVIMAGVALISVVFLLIARPEPDAVAAEQTGSLAVGEPEPAPVESPARARS